MKEKDIFVDYKSHQLILYAEKEDGTYGPIQSGSYISKNYIDDFWLKKKNLEKSLVEKLKEGEISPIYYYMTMDELSEKELAARVKICRSKLRKHLKPEHFPKIKLSLLKRYADVFNIPVVNFFQILIIKKDKEFISNIYKDEKLVNINIEQLPTKNPLVVITRIDDK